MTQLEDDSLVDGYSLLIRVEQRLGPSTIGEMANILLAARGTNPSPTVGKNWSSTFINRREEIRSRFSRRYDYRRALNEDPKSLREWFTTV